VTYPQGREATQYRPKGIMLKSIAWATDGSPSARQAFTVAKELARVHESRLLILHVQETGITRARLLADANDHIPVSLERVVEQLRAEGIDAELAVGEASDGAAHRTILDLAEEADVDLIIVGNRGHGPLAGLMLGSVALRLLQAARFPVLLVPSYRGTPTTTGPRNEC
jgi:nucleotide-binding universal stress UspA family protein